MIKRVKNKIARMKYETDRKISLVFGSFLGNPIAAYWPKKIINFGDLLTPLLLKKYGFIPIYSKANTSDIVSIGSILQVVPENYSGIIFGSGLIEDQVRHFPYAKILAVRGELTRNRINAPKNTILGDPGLLACELLETRLPKRYVMGLIPHYIDKNNEVIGKIFKRYSKDIAIIDVQRNPIEVIKDIDKCEFIVSSSLHGCVVADSLGIPNAWMLLSGKVRGNGFKFFDYASAYGCRYEPKILNGEENMATLKMFTHPVAEKIQEIKSDLHNVFRHLDDAILSN